MDCKKIKRRIPLYISGDLNPDEMKEAAVHIARCESCRSVAESYAAIRKQSVRIPAAEQEILENEPHFASVWNRIHTSSGRSRNTAFRLVFAGLAIFIVGLSLWKYQMNMQKPSLADYLMREDYTGLYKAFQDPDQQRRLMAESISTRLLIRKIGDCDSRMIRIAIPKLLPMVSGYESGRLAGISFYHQLQSLKYRNGMPSTITLNEALEWTHSKSALN